MKEEITKFYDLLKQWGYGMVLCDEDVYKNTNQYLLLSVLCDLGLW